MIQPMDAEFESRFFKNFLNVLVRLGLILVLVVNCYLIFAPFLSLMLWAIIMAITLFPMHQRLTTRLRGRGGLASLLMVGGAVAVIILPSAMLLNSMGDTIGSLVQGVQNNTLRVPLPPPGVASWPVVGKKLAPLWTQAATDLPAFIQQLQPKIGNVAKSAIGMVANLGGSLLLFLASFCIAGLMMVHGQSAGDSALAISKRMVGGKRGEHFANLSTSTIRAVARGVIGVAFIQAIIIGLVMTIAQVPAAGLWALIALIFGIAQAPAALLTLPAVAYVWMAGEHSTVAAIFYTVLLLVAGMSDNILKPLLLGRGVDAPMPVILLGALGGMVSAGILGLFVGSTVLTLGYQIFMDWVEEDSEKTDLPGTTEHDLAHPAQAPVLPAPAGTQATEANE